MVTFQAKPDLFIVIGIALIWLYISVNLNTILGLVYVVMIYFYWNMRQSGKVYPITKGKPNWSMNIGLALIVAFAWIYIIAGMIHSIAPAATVETYQKMFAITEKPMHPYMSLFIMGILIPVVEEPFFRASIIPYLNNYFKSKKFLVAVVSAAIFAVWHLITYNAANEAMISAFIFGILTYYVTVKSGNLLQAILIHISLNIIVMAGSLGFITIPMGMI